MPRFGEIRLSGQTFPPPAFRTENHMRMTLLALGAALALSACTSNADTATGPADGSQPDEPILETVDESQVESPKEPKPSDPPGTVAGFEVLGKVQVKPDGVNDYEAVFRVTNRGEKPKPSSFTVTLLKGQTILGTLDCGDYNKVQPGATATVQCYSTDKFQSGWNDVEIQYSGF